MPNEELVASGELNKRVSYEVKHYDGTQDEHGNKGYTWVQSVSRRASIKTVSGRESITADRLQIVASHVIVTRFLPDANAEGRFIYNSRVFNITYVNDINERHLRHEFFVNEVINSR